MDFKSNCEFAFLKKKWYKNFCKKCKKLFYSKKPQNVCGAYSCSQGYCFLEDQSPAHFVSFNQTLNTFKRFFNIHNFIPHDPIELIREHERTIFASTAGQIFDQYVYSNEINLHKIKNVILQPVIRLQELNQISKIDGYSTSFVHCATEIWNSDIDEHFRALDVWLDFFSELKLYVGDFSLVVDEKINSWGGLLVPAKTIGIYYKGLDLATANFFPSIPLLNASSASLSDIGGSAERIAWSINKSSSYFETIAPISRMYEHRIVLDCIRTATLIVGSGIRPDHRNHGSKLRKLLKNIQNVSGLYELVEYYQMHWASMFPTLFSKDEIYRIIRQEVDRNRNMAMNNFFKSHGNINQTHEKFIQSLLIEKRVSIEDLRNFYKNHAY